VLENVRQRKQHGCQESFDKICLQENFLHLTEIFQMSTYTLECHIIYLLFTKRFASRDCSPQLFIGMCGTIRSLKSTYTRSFIFDMHRKFLFLDFASRILKSKLWNFLTGWPRRLQAERFLIFNWKDQLMAKIHCELYSNLYRTWTIRVHTKSKPRTQAIFSYIRWTDDEEF
jgi:hypothetical protein